MIKKAVFEDDLINGMQRELQSYDKNQGMKNLVTAVDHLHSAMEILEESGLTAQANKILDILSKIAADEQDAKGKPRKPKDPTAISNGHTHGLTSERMLENLKQHGTVFNMADDGAADDLLNLEINDKELEVTDGSSYQKDFEDES